MSLRDLNQSDLWFTNDGDFLIDGSGDLKDTMDSGDVYEGLRQAILHRVISEKDAFRLYPNIAAGLGRFIGRNIDPHLIEAIQTAIHKALTADRALDGSEFKIRMLEVMAGYLAILIFVNLPNQEHPVISMAWNIRSGEVTRIN